MPGSKLMGPKAALHIHNSCRTPRWYILQTASPHTQSPWWLPVNPCLGLQASRLSLIFHSHSPSFPLSLPPRSFQHTLLPLLHSCLCSHVTPAETLPDPCTLLYISPQYSPLPDHKGGVICLLFAYEPKKAAWTWFLFTAGPQGLHNDKCSTGICHMNEGRMKGLPSHSCPNYMPNLHPQLPPNTPLADASLSGSGKAQAQPAFHWTSQQPWQVLITGPL